MCIFILHVASKYKPFLAWSHFERGENTSSLVLRFSWFWVLMFSTNQKSFIISVVLLHKRSKLAETEFMLNYRQRISERLTRFSPERVKRSLPRCSPWSASTCTRRGCSAGRRPWRWKPVVFCLFDAFGRIIAIVVKIDIAKKSLK